MSSPDTEPTRRTLLALGAGMAAATVVAGGPAAAAAPRNGRDVQGRLRDLEREHGARVGVFAHNTVTGRTVTHRADERFPMCSVFKPLAAAAILRDLDRDGEFLARRIRYSQADLVANSDVTKEHLAEGMTVGELCDAAIRFSDNTAGNLLLRQIGGPTAVTRFCRSIGDTTTRLDRWETELNSSEPWRVEDTTSPRAIALTYARLVLGNVLGQGDRQRLTTWLLNNTTSTHRFREGLPKDWAVADKTGASDNYGTNNDVGVAWLPDRSPVVLAVLTTKSDPRAEADNPLIVKTAALLASALV
ncbi:class A beta-lactamase [Streptomyces sp. NPDC006368]|uniref:class A beta-lactamase n=1 Tax=Streptomyces sp. NPDC006368 TaxID=3156760 RepID=UPI0033A62456